ncbi:protein EARLY RESPONSIVE TO DEHYDRATION 15-like [Dioscorea cayenensis subsp. rotundata]|uniref:Protein EARLY RESPONSIVE TO DEHYDRATION 15-like n=1 Tax=Dioscorea cayennensis subsp. rotundata TaxID=55577 RepID=A0AB40C9I3_DIOCR|nr:protein EARLY RESPONSIVE TO DEHYDRATION 15-like [Dioscorea cayenensis subsp. rotundata]
MDVISGRMASTLNPNAEPFVPAVYRSVEDFSDDWWALVQSTPWFRDYWLRECFYEELISDADLDLLGFDDPELSDVEADLLFHSYPSLQQEEEKKRMEVMAWGTDKWKGIKGRMEVPKNNNEKAAKIVNLRVSPRMIQQPR